MFYYNTQKHQLFEFKIYKVNQILDKKNIVVSQFVYNKLYI